MSYEQESVWLYARAVGEENPAQAWILSPLDTWEKNPCYSGPPVRHPEDEQEDTNPNPCAWQLNDVALTYAVAMATLPKNLTGSLYVWRDGDPIESSDDPSVAIAAAITHMDTAGKSAHVYITDADNEPVPVVLTLPQNTSVAESLAAQRGIKVIADDWMMWEAQSAEPLRMTGDTVAIAVARQLAYQHFGSTHIELPASVRAIMDRKAEEALAQQLATPTRPTPATLDDPGF